jgi:hypothetical protein
MPMVSSAQGWHQCSFDSLLAASLSSALPHIAQELELDLKNLEIAGASEVGAKKYTVDLRPGQNQFMVLKEVEKKQAYGLSIRAEFSLDKIVDPTAEIAAGTAALAVAAPEAAAAEAPAAAVEAPAA